MITRIEIDQKMAVCVRMTELTPVFSL